MGLARLLTSNDRPYSGKRTTDPHGRLSRYSPGHGALGSGGPASAAGNPAASPLEQQSRRRRHRYAAGAADLSDRRGWAGAGGARTRLGPVQRLRRAGWVSFVVSILALDLAIYLQHVMFHAVPALWRLHRMHHADLEFDVTTGLRFHPIEILLSMGIKLAVVAALGPPVAAVLVFEVLLNATAMFNHSNIRIPSAIDRVLRLFVVTPDMHRVHHSIHPSETNSNFGFNLPWWDRLLGTYRPQPRDGHEAMTIGIEQFRTRRDLWLDRMLIQPARGPASGYPINRENSEKEQ